MTHIEEQKFDADYTERLVIHSMFAVDSLLAFLQKRSEILVNQLKILISYRENGAKCEAELFYNELQLPENKLFELSLKIELNIYCCFVFRALFFRV